MTFVPSVSAQTGPQMPACWFFFRKNALLVERYSGETSIPCKSDISTLDLHIEKSVFIGTLNGKDCYAAACSEEDKPPDGMAFTGLRALYEQLDEESYRVAGRAYQLMKWDMAHQYCGGCGIPTVDGIRERAKVCPQCGQKNFPRLSPAIIVAIIKDNQILLARSQRFPSKLYSVIAGFVEPGETLEQCVQREVKEEVGVTVDHIRYFGSQPWPFPDSLMIGFTARYRGGEIVLNDEEIVDAGWFDAHNLPPIPEKLSIARQLIDWFVRTSH